MGLPDRRRVILHQWKGRNESGVNAELCLNIYSLVIEGKKPRRMNKALSIHPERMQSGDGEPELTWEQMAFIPREWLGDWGRPCVDRVLYSGANLHWRCCEVLDEYHLFRPGVVGTLGPLLRNLRNTKNFMQMYFHVGTKATAFTRFSKVWETRKG